MKHRIDNPKNQFTIRLVNVAKAFGCTTIGQLEEQLLRLPESTNRIGYYPFNKKMLLREIKDFKRECEFRRDFWNRCKSILDEKP